MRGNRVKLSFTVHPDTPARIEELRRKFQMPAGRMLDRLFATLQAAYASGMRHCVHGGACRFELKDLPPVM